MEMTGFEPVTSCLQSIYSTVELHPLLMGFPGVKGFEPLNLDTKNRRLTAWLYSNPYNWVITDSNR